MSICLGWYGYATTVRDVKLKHLKGNTEMSNKNNQMRNYKIRQNALTDVEKLAGLESFIIHECHARIVPQAWLLFVKGEDQYIGWRTDLNEYEVNTYKPHHPDILVFTDDMIIVELDGDWHKLPPGKKDIARNKRYELNDITYIVINEEELKMKLRPDIKPKSWSLSQDQINAEFKERFDAL